MFANIQSKILLIMGVAIALMAIAFGGYFWYSQRQIAILHQNNGKLEGALSTQKETISSLEKKFTIQSKEVQNLQLKNNLAEIQHRELVAKLREFDLNNSARSNPSSTESKINTDTDNALKELEAITGGSIIPKQSTSKPTTTGDIQPPPRPPIRSSK